MDEVVMHIDMNSYFASVEQQANPHLAGKPIAVSGRPYIHSVVAAASIEAKKFGVRSGMSTWEAKKLCPGLIFVPGNPAKYIDLSGRLIKIFRDFSPTVEIFSIDEAFLDITSLDGCTLSDRVQPFRIAGEIKQRIKDELGEKITCSIGIAKNKLLAKLASEKKKPDGLTIINENNLDAMLLSSKLDDFCGIGRQTLAHLQAMGIYTVAQLRQVPLECLTAAFGRHGRDIFNMAFGIDNAPVVASDTGPEAKSFSHTLTLERETSDRKQVEAVLLYLAEKAARRMRQEGFCGRTIHTLTAQRSLPQATSNGLEIYKVGRQLMNFDLPVRVVGIGVSNLVKKDRTSGSWLPEVQKEEKIITSLDFVNDRFGENAVFRAATLPVFSRDRRVAGIRTKMRFN
ncbi:MAG: DNA polymerase IV [Patescibacteria group bacterium]|nr:DNA polymerase IV [Patescibacteria group bacterium]MCL5431805.1 DNA polymerase IV [Patescibacteria group bacterium]